MYYYTRTISHCASVLHDAGSRALGALVSKHYTSKGLDFKVYEKIYNSTVVPVMDYSAGVWGYKTFDSHDKLHHTTIYYYQNTTITETESLRYSTPDYEQAAVL